MKNMRTVILVMMVVVGSTGYALEEPEKFMDVYAIQTKNHKHREMLDIMHEGHRNGTRAFMNGNDLLIVNMIRMGFHDTVRDMRAIDRVNCLRLQEDLRQQAQQRLKEWGYQV
jgi:hypothetical protein